MENLVKRYDKEVLNLARLTLHKGRVYGIIGPNGSGKSTFLRIVNLLVAPDAGKITLFGQPASANSKTHLAQRRRMTLVFQKTTLFRCSVFENVAYGLKVRGYKGREVKKKVEMLLDKVGLGKLAGRRADTLSGGEAQRVALARALGCEPSLLLLDEPAANLDPVNVELMEKLILDLKQTADMTIVMVTHNIFQARRIADEVIFLYDGRVVEMDRTEQIFTSPADPRTKSFIEGRMVY